MTPTWKPTPKEKIFEAWSAVADGRVKIADLCRAEVQSSDGTKTYSVVWTPDKTSFGANDNASFFVGYAGYPIIAVLMQLGLLEFEPRLIEMFRGINWNKLNQIYKRNYAAAVEYVLTGLEDGNAGSAAELRHQADTMFKAFKGLNLGRMAPPGVPPQRK